MGTFRIEVILPGRTRLLALVDTGATFSKLPADRLGELKVKPCFSTKVQLGDGQVVRRRVGYVEIRLDGHSAPVPVMFGARGEEPLIGATTLEILGLAVDPVRKRLVECVHLEM